MNDEAHGRLFTDGVMDDRKRLELVAMSGYFVRDMLRRFIPQQAKTIPASNIGNVVSQIASDVAQFLWEHREQ